MTIYLILFFVAIFLISLLFLFIGLISPKAGLFWYKKTKTRSRSSLIYGLTSLLSIVIIISLSVFKSHNNASDSSDTTQSHSIADLAHASPEELGRMAAEIGKNVTNDMLKDDSLKRDSIDKILNAKAPGKADREKADKLLESANPKVEAKDFGAAYQVINKSIALYPGNSKAYFYRANVKYKMKDTVGCMNDYSIVLAIDSNYVGVYLNRGIVYIFQKDREAALYNLNKAIEKKRANRLCLLL